MIASKDPVRILFAIFILIIDTLSAQTLEQRIKRLAEVDGYGYKYANLTILTEITQEFNKQQQKQQVYQVLVPAFGGIPTENIQQFFKKNGFDIADEWADIIEKYHFSEIDIQEAILSSKQFPDEFLLDQKTFADKLLKNIDDAIEKNQNESSLDNIFQTTKIDELLKLVKSNNERLMVRSTGKEDTKKLANAGGNVSVSNVEPIIPEVMYALGDVVVSYFGQKSLKQRLDAGDRSIFDPKPFTPVLIQRMIGEKDLTKIPKCGVMFTEEAEGGIARYARRDAENNVMGKLKTTGITIIQAAFGHNEGVVNSLVPVDSYYVTNAFSIDTVIRPKTYRMMPDPNVKRSLMLVLNNESMVHEPALAQDALITLKKFSQKLEEIYNDAMDGKRRHGYCQSAARTGCTVAR